MEARLLRPDWPGFSLNSVSLVPPSIIYSYITEALPDGRWRWTVFGEDRKPVRSGSAKDEQEARLAALHAIDALKIHRKPSF